MKGLENNKDMLKVRCPKCRSTLTIINVLDIEDKKIKCPVCNCYSGFTECILVKEDVRNSDIYDDSNHPQKFAYINYNKGMSDLELLCPKCYVPLSITNSEYIFDYVINCPNCCETCRVSHERLGSGLVALVSDYYNHHRDFDDGSQRPGARPVQAAKYIIESKNINNKFEFFKNPNYDYLDYLDDSEIWKSMTKNDRISYLNSVANSIRIELCKLNNKNTNISNGEYHDVNRRIYRLRLYETNVNSLINEIKYGVKERRKDVTCYMPAYRKEENIEEEVKEIIEEKKKEIIARKNKTKSRLKILIAIIIIDIILWFFLR